MQSLKGLTQFTNLTVCEVSKTRLDRHIASRDSDGVTSLLVTVHCLGGRLTAVHQETHSWSHTAASKRLHRTGRCCHCLLGMWTTRQAAESHSQRSRKVGSTSLQKTASPSLRLLDRAKLLVCRLWLPEELSSLHFLKSLSLTAESTTRALPAWLGQLRSLEELHVCMEVTGG